MHVRVHACRVRRRATCSTDQGTCARGQVVEQHTVGDLARELQHPGVERADDDLRFALGRPEPETEARHAVEVAVERHALARQALAHRARRTRAPEPAAGRRRSCRASVPRRPVTRSRYRGRRRDRVRAVAAWRRPSPRVAACAAAARGRRYRGRASGPRSTTAPSSENASLPLASATQSEPYPSSFGEPRGRDRRRRAERLDAARPSPRTPSIRSCAHRHAVASAMSFNRGQIAAPQLR